jgi:ABC-type amino acid transport substrate-binding protein
MNNLSVIKKRGAINAGVSLGFKGFSIQDEVTNHWKGFDIDIARAVAAGVFGDSRCVNYIPLQSGNRFSALQEGLIDLGVFNSSITFTREVFHDVRFIQPILFDGEALLTRLSNLYEGEKALNSTSVKNKKIAAMYGSTTKENLIRYFSSRNLSFEIILFDSPTEARKAYELGECDLYCLDYYLLSGEKSVLRDSEQHVILNDVVSLEAMSPAVSNKDTQWAMAVSWIIRSLIEAEELGITSRNIQTLNISADSYVEKFLCPDKKICELLGLVENFTQKVISEVGNYSEIFARNLGKNSELKLERRDNKLRSEGGLLYSPLFI